MVLKKRLTAPPKKKPPLKPKEPFDLILKRVKIRSFSQCRAVASKILKELINGGLPPERVRYAIPLLNVIVACNQSIYLRARLSKISEALNLDPDVPIASEDSGEGENEAAEDALESDEPKDENEDDGA